MTVSTSLHDINSMRSNHFEEKKGHISTNFEWDEKKKNLEIIKFFVSWIHSFQDDEANQNLLPQ